MEWPARVRAKRRKPGVLPSFIWNATRRCCQSYGEKNHHLHVQQLVFSLISDTVKLTTKILDITDVQVSSKQYIPRPKFVSRCSFIELSRRDESASWGSHPNSTLFCFTSIIIHNFDN